MSEEEEPIPLKLQAMGASLLLRVQVRKEKGAVLNKSLMEGKGGKKGGQVRKEETREGRKEERKGICACSTCVTTISSSFCINLASSMRADMDLGK